ncbi:MAG: class I SAM-dependent methyltransferase [Planctomycetota bacterium]
MFEVDKLPGMDEQVDNSSTCGYCGESRSLKLYPTRSIAGDRFGLNRCLSCRAVFLSPQPTEEQLARAYDDTYYGPGETKFTAPIEKALDHFRWARARRVRSYIAPQAKVLDVGCGNGRFLGYLIKRGFGAYGTELPGRAAERAAQIPQLNLKVGPLEDAGFTEGFFDAICMWHVFEHLTAPKETLEIVRNILKPEGYLFMSLPNIDSLQSRLFKGRWLHLDPPKHPFLLGPKDLTAQMKLLGFSLMKIRHFSLEQNPFGFQQSILNCLLSKREVLYEALKGNTAYTHDYSAFSIIMQNVFCLAGFPIFALLAAVEAVLRKGGTIELVFRSRKE